MNKVNKEDLLKELCQQIAKDLKMLVESALIAREAATSEESKAENKYDTRGLEASYLAGAQAKRSQELQRTLDKLQTLKIRSFDPESPVYMTALVEVAVTTENEDEGVQKNFFILPSSGGTKILFKNQEFLIITPESSVGRALIGKHLDDLFPITVNGRVYNYEVTGLS